MAFRARGVKALRRAWARAKLDAAYRRPILGHRTTMAKLTMTDVLDELAVGGDLVVKAVPTHGGWVDIDTPDDLVVGEERWNASPALELMPAEPAATPPAAGGPVTGAYTNAGPEGGGLPTFHPVRRWR